MSKTKALLEGLGNIVRKPSAFKEEKYDFDKHNVRGQLSKEPNKYDIAFDNMQKTGTEELRKRAEALAKAVIFEQNDDTTRLGFTNALTSYLAEVQARRGITDFQVVCDTTNNTPSVIDRNEFVAEVYVKPTRSINYITLSFVATRTGVSFSEVVGRA